MSNRLQVNLVDLSGILTCLGLAPLSLRGVNTNPIAGLYISMLQRLGLETHICAKAANGEATG